MGKGWARGLTKQTDSRVYRAAEGHRGPQYRCQRRRNGAGRYRQKYPRLRTPKQDGEWTRELAYAVGLIATDGCLSSDNKTVVQVSKDRELLETFKRCLGSEAPVSWNRRAFRVQIADVAFYDWLLSVGLTPRKSLTLGRLAVPDRFFLETVRGLLDGDGNIYTGLTIPNRRRYPDHAYQRLVVRFHSASRQHIEWLRSELERNLV